MKPDFEPLLGPGRHRLSLAELRKLCVVPGCDTRRFDAYAALYSLLKKLEAFSITCEAWVDGSFVTAKPAPSDVDVSVMIESAIYDSLSREAKDFIQELNSLEGKYEQYVDVFVHIAFPMGTEERAIDPPESYAQLWGREHSERYLKGFVVLEVQGAVR